VIRLASNKRFENYVEQVVSVIPYSQKRANIIRKKLIKTLEEKNAQTGEQDPVILMGPVDDVAKKLRNEFLETIPLNNPYEYKSKTTFMGLPLVHINRRYGGVAKGIIAIGSVSIGVVALGAVSIGLLAFGGISLGLIVALGGVAAGGLGALGGLALSLLYAFGGAAISLSASFGGFALSSNIAVGGYASGKELAIGGIANGRICIFNQSGTGEHLFNISEYTSEELIHSLKLLKPDISDFMENIIKFFSYRAL